MASEGTEPASPAKTIARGIVSIYKEYLGRGPTSARATIGDEFVTILCEDGLTKAEKQLVERGDADVVREIRRKFQIAMSADIKRLVEQTTGRKSRALLSDHDVEQDIAIETVVFQ
jgi:uncharacterized protein YbcI